MITNNGPVLVTVSQLNFYIKSLVDSDDKLRYVFVSGEISNLTDHYSSGHIYLSLKDNKSVIKAVMFSFSAKNLKFRPQNGMKVIARGRVSVYEPSGQYQLYIEDMQPDGVGSLAVAFEQLKEKLCLEGLFSPDVKKPLPKYPRKITIITSPTGAALQDIFNVLRRRWPCCDVEVVPVLVQGDDAARMLKKAVEDTDKKHDADVIIIGRGGGSIEDLWAFNDEDLARAIFKCSIPVVSAVGHETDFTICDFVSDMRAPTPSAAAEMATPEKVAELDVLSKYRIYLTSIADNIIGVRQRELADLVTVLMKNDLYDEFSQMTDRLTDLETRLISLGDKLLSEQSNCLDKLGVRLFSLDPKTILGRGYSLVAVNDKIIGSKFELQKGDRIKIVFKDGSVNAVVE